MSGSFNVPVIATLPIPVVATAVDEKLAVMLSPVAATTPTKVPSNAGFESPYRRVLSFAVTVNGALVSVRFPVAKFALGKS